MGSIRFRDVPIETEEFESVDDWLSLNEIGSFEPDHRVSACRIQWTTIGGEPTLAIAPAEVPLRFGLYSRPITGTSWEVLRMEARIDHERLGEDEFKDLTQDDLPKSSRSDADSLVFTEHPWTSLWYGAARFLGKRRQTGPPSLEMFESNSRAEIMSEVRGSTTDLWETKNPVASIYDSAACNGLATRRLISKNRRFVLGLVRNFDETFEKYKESKEAKELLGKAHEGELVVKIAGNNTKTAKSYVKNLRDQELAQTLKDAATEYFDQALYQSLAGPEDPEFVTRIAKEEGDPVPVARLAEAILEDHIDRIHKTPTSFREADNVDPQPTDDEILGFLQSDSEFRKQALPLLRRFYFD